MKHRNSVRELARKRGPVSLVLSVLLFANLIVPTHSGVAAVPFQTFFVDPSATRQCNGAFKPCTFGATFMSARLRFSRLV